MQSTTFHPFYSISAWLLLLTVTAVLLAAGLAGLLVGRAMRQRDAGASQLGTIQASMLGLLALILGFTFSVASSRYDARRLLCVEEANALGTTYLRAQTLPEPYRADLSKLLSRLRLRTPPAINDPIRSTRILRQADRLQQEMWGQASALARDNPSPVKAVFLTSLNESIDLSASRKAAYFARVPATILWILSFIAFVVMALIGYGFGLSGQRGLALLALVSLLIAVVVVMIVDLDRPYGGPTRIGQEPMLDLRSSLTGYEQASRR
jgi:hypothetical protein